jgi:hypothetical protein
MLIVLAVLGILLFALGRALSTSSTQTPPLAIAGQAAAPV